MMCFTCRYVDAKDYLLAAARREVTNPPSLAQAVRMVSRFTPSTYWLHGKVFYTAAEREKLQLSKLQSKPLLCADDIISRPMSFFSSTALLILRKTQMVLSSLGINFWMNSSTLLGWLREVSFPETLYSFYFILFYSATSLSLEKTWTSG